MFDTGTKTKTIQSFLVKKKMFSPCPLKSNHHHLSPTLSSFIYLFFYQYCRSQAEIFAFHPTQCKTEQYLMRHFPHDMIRMSLTMFYGCSMIDKVHLHI